MKIANRFASGLVGFLTLWPQWKFNNCVTPLKLVFFVITEKRQPEDLTNYIQITFNCSLDL